MKVSRTVTREFNDGDASKCDSFTLELPATICPTILAETIELSNSFVYLQQVDGIADLELVVESVKMLGCEVEDDKLEVYLEDYLDSQARNIRDNRERMQNLTEKTIRENEHEQRVLNMIARHEAGLDLFDLDDEDDDIDDDSE